MVALILISWMWIHTVRRKGKWFRNTLRLGWCPHEPLIMFRFVKTQTVAAEKIKGAAFDKIISALW